MRWLVNGAYMLKLPQEVLFLALYLNISFVLSVLHEGTQQDTFPISAGERCMAQYHDPRFCPFIVITLCAAAVLLTPPTDVAAGGETGAEKGSSEDPELSSVFTGQLIFPIYVSDVRRSAEFYRDVFGFEFLGYYDYDRNAYVCVWSDSIPPTYAGFRAGDQTFGLHKPANESQETCIGCGRYYFRVHDLEEHHERISALGVEISRIHSSALLTRFFVRDPDGTLVFFAVTNVTAPLDPW
jgi:predicted enzyme related to lactoylglutathione lyase